MKNSMLDDIGRYRPFWSLLVFCLWISFAISASAQTNQWSGTYTGIFFVYHLANYGNGNIVTTSQSTFTIKIDAQGNLVDGYNSDGTPWGLRNNLGFSGGTTDANGMMRCSYYSQTALIGDVYETIRYSMSIGCSAFAASASSQLTDEIDGFYTDANGIHYVSSFTDLEIGSYYLLRDVAQMSSPGNRPGDLAGDPIDTATGAHYIREKLLAVKGARELNFDLQYDSNLLASDELGVGWGHNFEASVRVGDQPNTLILRWNANCQNTFSASSSAGAYASTDYSVQYDQLVQDPDGSYILVRKDQSRLLFDSSGNLTKEINPSGQAIVVTRSQAFGNRPIQLTEVASGQSLNLQYQSASGPLVSVSDPLERTINFSYGGGGNTFLNQITRNASDGSVAWSMTYTYDSYGRILTGTDKEGRVVFTDSYDGYYDGHVGFIGSQRDAVSGHPASQYRYDDVSEPGVRRVTITDRNWNTVLYRYDLKYNLLSRTDQTGLSDSYSYDAFGNVLSHTNKNGHTTTYTYDAHGNLLTMADPSGQMTIFIYDGLNRLISVSDPKNQTTIYTYDSNNNVTGITDPVGNQTALTWDTNSLLLTAQLPRSGIESYTYTNGLPI